MIEIARAIRVTASYIVLTNYPHNKLADQIVGTSPHASNLVKELTTLTPDDPSNVGHRRKDRALFTY